MIVRFPVTLENGMIIGEERIIFENGQMFNGYDADGNRLTNIIGFDGNQLLKWCPHCEQVFPSADFGTEGRPDNDHARRRDQSWCKACRKG